MTLLLPWIVVVIGLLLYFIPFRGTYSKLNEVGRLLFFCGAFWIVARESYSLSIHSGR